MRQVVIVAPEFPPANSAAVHRSRIFAGHLLKYGWNPIILTVEKDQIEGPPDESLEGLLPSGVEVVRTSAIPFRPWRFVGDMGLRCLWHHSRALENLCRTRRIDLIFIPGPPWFMFLLGPRFLKRRGIPFVVDYIDPWISTWSAQARFLSKQWFYHRLAGHYEVKVLRAASHVTAVSWGIHEELRARYSFLSTDKLSAMPYGGDPRDFEALKKLNIEPPDFKPADGYFNICFTGALQPLGFEILRALFAAVKQVKERKGPLFDRLKIRFYGTSNSTWRSGWQRALPVAEEFGVGECVTEISERVPYLKSLAVQQAADLNLIMGSSEKYYHASKLYPCLLAGRPLLAICHEEASIVRVLKDLGLGDSFVTFSQPDKLGGLAEGLYEKIISVAENPKALPPIEWERFRPYSAEGVTEALALAFDRVIKNKHSKNGQD